MGATVLLIQIVVMSEAIGAVGEDIMFSSNATPAEEFVYADKLGGIINLDDFTHIDFLEKAIGHIPETISCRYNPVGCFKSAMILWTILEMRNME